MKSLLILGEYQDDFVNKNIKGLQRYAREESLNPRVMSYEELLRGKTPRIPTPLLDVMFFFPYTFWGLNCEIPSDTGIYGTSRESHEIFRNFFRGIKEKIESQFSDKDISYVIDPDYASIDRDKLAVNELLVSKGVSTTKMLPKDLDRILEFSKTKGVFIKARYGAMGKGITYLSPRGWFTNYRVLNKNHLGNYETDCGWRFTQIDGNIDVIKTLLDLEVVVEEEVVPSSLTRGKKFDIRAYSIFGYVPHMFVKENEISSIITNYCQGGTVDHNYKKRLSKDAISLVINQVRNTSNVLNSNFLGVDVIFDGNFQTPKVMEAQTFSGFPRIRKFNLTRFLAQQIKNKD